LENRVALITGGAGGLGRVFAETLSELGARIVLLDRDATALAAVQQVPELRRGRCEALAIDLEKEDVLRTVPERIERLAGRLDILINGAAFTGSSDLPGWVAPFERQSAEAWRRALEVNLTAPFLLSQICAPLLSRNRCGAIINILSIYGLVGPDFRLYEGTTMENPAAYNASKGGLLQLTRYLATALAPSIRVNAISPGGLFRQQDPAFVTRYEARTPLARMGTEEDLKGAVAYLASDLSAYVTGQNLIVDGGWTAW
jgi:NAD(P)-dependent dehydrogenase (short-subunit alcohol dehydrogenase family)